MRDLIALLAAIRLTRLVTRDWAGEWCIIQPANAWAEYHEGVVDVHSEQGLSTATSTETWRSKLVSGLNCPHCVGFWLTLGTLAASRLPLPQPLAKVRDLGLDALAGSYVVGHVSSRFDG